jgi:hypothetical protein
LQHNAARRAALEAGMGARLWLGTLLLCGCTGTLRVAEIDFVATQKLAVPTAIVKRNATGRACTTFAFSGMPNIEEALTAAQRDAETGEALANVAVYIERTYYFVATRLCYVVIGDVVKLTGE